MSNTTPTAFVTHTDTHDDFIVRLRGITAEAIVKYQSAARALGTIADEGSLPLDMHLDRYTIAKAEAEGAMIINRGINTMPGVVNRPVETADMDKFMHSLNREIFHVVRRQGVHVKTVEFLMNIADAAGFHMTENTLM
jgi:ketopantoate reductase